MNFVLRITLGLSVLWISEAIGQRRPPNYSQDQMPVTSFSCRDKILGGYYADPETDCQMFHVCVKVPGLGVQDYKFLCPNDTSFDQENQICDDWYNIDCEAATLFYSDNFDLYRIGSESSRVKEVPRLPNNNINNAVSDRDDDYLQRNDRGENVGSDLLRGSHSGNFFSNKNRGKEDEDFEESKKKKPANGKSNVRKLLTGKRPIPSTTQATYHATSQPRTYLAGRNRVTSNFNKVPTEAPLRQTEVYNQNQRQNYNQRNYNPTTQNPQQQQYYNPTTQKPQQQQYYNPTTQKPQQQQYYNPTTQKPQQQQYYNPTTQKPQQQQYYNPTTQKPQQQQYYNPTTQKPQQQYYNPTTQKPQQYYNPTTQKSQQQQFYNPTQPPKTNYYENTQNYNAQATNFNYSPTTQKQQNFQTTRQQPPTTAKPYSQQQFYNPTTQKQQQFYNPTTQKPQQFYNPTTQSTEAQSVDTNYETQKLFRLNTQGFNNANQYDEPSNGEFLKTAPSQNLGASNFNRVQNSYKTFNASVSSSYNFISPSTTQKTTPKPQTTQNYNPTTQRQQTQKQTTQKAFQQQFFNPTTARPQQNFFIPNSTPAKGRGSAAHQTDATEKPRPFTTLSPVPAKEAKEKEQYDYAYYDDAAHPEYENIDALDFARTKSKKQ
ncbi:probable basic-leucine zipper transcription factor Q isoform X2 [Cimex lectularius]|uniref:Chitin-binding type-2 domain-containing protein n=1 Tax=Cimex lectularius TaxID=79782 RepID=A0A8I6S6H0_CIMLE|nr:probable basic-leucine zipper transcription factor Q isoform X2 [Cimex lectularius]